MDMTLVNNALTVAKTGPFEIDRCETFFLKYKTRKNFGKERIFGPDQDHGNSLISAQTNKNQEILNQAVRRPLVQY